MNYLLQKGGTTPQSYSGSDLKYVGICECVVMCRNEITTLKFVVIDTQYQALLGLTACSKLNLIKLVYSISQTEKDEFVAKNIDLFEGLGCFVRNLDMKLKAVRGEASKENSTIIIYTGKRRTTTNG